MIDVLCERILNNELFISDFEVFINSGIELMLTKSISDKAALNQTTLRKLLQTASIFSMSTSIQNKQKAYEIAVTAWKHLQNNTILNVGFDEVANIIGFILARLGNFPAEMKFENDYGKNLDIPTPLWFEEEFHRVQNTIKISDNNEITLTDFQNVFWKAMEQYSVVIITAPTSAGKTYVLQHYLASLFFAGAINRAVYIVPTRALISQILTDLHAIFENIPSIQITEIPSKMEGKVLYVLTQERMQMLLEHEVCYDYVVIDEAQNISDASRGIILQSVTERLTLANPTLKILFGSPFTKNPSVFKKTFGFPDSDVSIIDTQVSPVMQNLLHVKTNLYKNNQLSVNKISPSNYMYEENIATIITDNEFVDRSKMLAQIAHTLGDGDNNIVFGSEPSSCEEIAHLLTMLNQQDDSTKDSELLDFSQYLRSHVHKDYLLAHCIEHGVAFHYGNLPTFIRKGIEYLCAAGKIEYLVCTSTLLQGVNLPAKNIFILDPTKGRNQDQTPIPLSPTEFWNLAGRAGRLTKDFEGNIFLIDLEKWTGNPLVTPDKHQSVVPSFTNYICSGHSNIAEFMMDKQHRSGLSSTQGLENSFMKLYCDYNQGRLDNTLDLLGDNLTHDRRSELTDLIKSISQEISVPFEVVSKNPTVISLSSARYAKLLFKEDQAKRPRVRYPAPSNARME